MRTNQNCRYPTQRTDTTCWLPDSPLWIGKTHQNRREGKPGEGEPQIGERCGVEKRWLQDVLQIKKMNHTLSTDMLAGNGTPVPTPVDVYRNVPGTSALNLVRTDGRKSAPDLC